MVYICDLKSKILISLQSIAELLGHRDGTKNCRRVQVQADRGHVEPSIETIQDRRRKDDHPESERSATQRAREM